MFEEKQFFTTIFGSTTPVEYYPQITSAYDK